LRNIPEERRSHLDRGGSLKSRIVIHVSGKENWIIAFVLFFCALVQFSAVGEIVRLLSCFCVTKNVQNLQADDLNCRYAGGGGGGELYKTNNILVIRSHCTSEIPDSKQKNCIENLLYSLLTNAQPDKFLLFFTEHFVLVTLWSYSRVIGCFDIVVGFLSNLIDAETVNSFRPQLFLSKSFFFIFSSLFTLRKLGIWNSILRVTSHLPFPSA
jgi:hypothetical protein